MSAIRHPAKFPPQIVGLAAAQLRGYQRVLDPFAGTGRVHDLSIHFQKHDTIGVEIEPDWEPEGATPGPMILGDSRELPFADGVFDAIFTSPVYGNRMSDHHNAQDASDRNTYTHKIGHDLHPNNAGRMYFWQPAYKQLHRKVWSECVRVLRPGGRFVLNSKNFYRGDTFHQVTDWHVAELRHRDLIVTHIFTVKTPGNRFGANRTIRVNHEDVIVLDKPLETP